MPFSFRPYNNNWKRLLKFLLPFLFTIGLFGYVGTVVAGTDPSVNSLRNASGVQNFLISFFECTGTFVIVWYFRKNVDKESFVSLGFQKTNLSDILIGLITGFTIMLLGFSTLLFFNQIKVVGHQFAFFDFVSGIGLFITVALMEELLVRGYVLNNLMSCMNKYSALIISAAIFSILHGANLNITLLSLINLFLAGTLLGLSYIYTKNLWLPIALHFSWNFFQGTVFGFNVSGNKFYSIIHQRTISDNIWNGGSFGFEGSVLCVIFQIIAIWVIYKLFRNHKTLTTDFPCPASAQNPVLESENY